VIKTVLALRHGIAPPTLHATTPSPHIDWSAGEVELLTEARPWPDTGRVRRAGVSSFGLSGTNAHLVIEQAPATEEPADLPEPDVVPWVLSAATDEALVAQALRLAQHVTGQRSVDVAHALTTRTRLARHAVVAGADGAELLAGLTALANGETPGEARAPDGSTAFLFTGQGAQRLGMGRQAYQAFPVFAAAFDAVLAELDRQLDRPLREVMWGEDEEALNQTRYAQPALFAVEVALFRLFESAGVVPDFVAGHSIGEIAAAHAAGACCLADAAILVAARGRLMQALPGGAMAAVAAGEDEVRPLLGGQVDIAAINGPDSVVVSGAEDAVAALADAASAMGRRTTRLRVSHAFHSVLMEPMLEDFRQVLDGLTFAEPVIPLISNESGDPVGIPDVDYWVRHVRAAVRFADGVRYLTGPGGVTRFVEIGPDGVLAGLTRPQVSEHAAVLTTLRRNRSEPHDVMTALGRLHANGIAVDWTAALPGARWVDLPTYAFQHRRYWAEPAASGDPAGVGQAAADHQLLGAVVTVPDSGGLVLTGRLSAATTPWLTEHVLLGNVVVPNSALADMCCYAGELLGCASVDRMTFDKPLVLPDERSMDTRIVVGAEDDSGTRPVSVHSKEAGSAWIRHAVGSLRTGRDEPDSAPASWPPPGAAAVDVAGGYERLAVLGHHYGPALRRVVAAWQRGEELYAEIALDDEPAPARLHPVLLDAALNASRLVACDPALTVPAGIAGLRMFATGTTGSPSAIRVRIRPAATGYTVDVSDAGGRPVAAVDQIETAVLNPGQLAARTVPLELFGLRWQKLAPGTEFPADAAVLGRCHGVPDLPVYDTLDDAATGPGTLLTEDVDAVSAWLADPRFAAGLLYVVTTGAVAVDGGDADLTQASVWDAVHDQQSVHPGRIVLVDSDESDLPVVEILAAGEPVLAVRAGSVLVPRVVPVPAPGSAPELGGTAVLAGLGAAAARQVVALGVRDLVLCCSSDADATSLTAALVDLDATVRVATGDLADVLAAIPAGPLTVLTSDRETAVRLHELTRNQELTAFIVLADHDRDSALFAALAAHRRHRGLPVLIVGQGVDPRGALSANEIATVLGGALALGEPIVFPARLDLDRWRVRTNAPSARPLFLDLVAGPRPATTHGTARPALRERLVGLAPDEQRHVLLDLVRTWSAAVLGHAGPDDIRADRGFLDLGFDSLTAVELRTNLTAVTGLRLPATLIFDYPTPHTLAGHLWTELTGAGAGAGAGELDVLLARVESALLAADPDEAERARIQARLRSLVAGRTEAHRAPGAADDLSSVSASDLFGILDDELEGAP
jgi:acyl transferase domain-containing protein/acyl carrier protein